MILDPPAAPTLRWHAWRDLDPDTLYALLKLRSDIFVVEQNCAFSDMDGLDPRCAHLCATGADGRLLGCLRLLPPGLKGRLPVIGRLVVDASARGGRLGRAIMEEGLKRCAHDHPGQDIGLSAQRQLVAFYASLGFAVAGEAYLEDGIAHVDMVRRASDILRR